MLTVLGTEIRTNWRKLILHGIAFAILFHVVMLLALLVRFQAWPNYVTFYDWIGNVAWIIQSTPSWKDMLPIIAEEWLIEIGEMNYEWGGGISIWSLNVVPSRMLVLAGLGAMLSLCVMLMRADTCSANARNTVRATSGLGVLLVAMTNTTMSWVVCCAAPSWAVGLAMLGVGVSTSLALESMGPSLTYSGFGLLSALILYLAWRKTQLSDPKGAPSHA